MASILYSTKTVAELRTILRAQELPVSGVKQDLVARLVQASQNGIRFTGKLSVIIILIMSVYL